MFREFLKGIFDEIGRIVSFNMLGTIAAGTVITYVAVDSRPDKEVATEEIDIKEEKVLEKNQPSIKNKSIVNNTNINTQKSPTLAANTFKVSSLNKTNFSMPESVVQPNNDNENDNDNYNYFSGGNSGSSQPGGYRSIVSNHSSSIPLIRQEVINNDISSNKDTSSSQGSASSSTSSYPDSIASNALSNQKTDTATKSAINSTSSTSSTSSGGGKHVPVENTCSANIDNGSFGNPIGVNLSCLYPSSIKYCLSRVTGVCCDPETNGTSYNTQVVIGPKDGNYCLSYIGTSDVGGTSIIYQKNYTINSTLPNLTAGHTQTYFQSTELEGTSFITSLDFGKPNYSIGQINLKSHDPSPSNLNYSCDDILANYSTLSAPIASQILSQVDVSLMGQSSQVEVPLRLDLLDYGDNYITSYIENNSYVAPLYSCSTSKITLDDFEFFQDDVSHSIAGDNNFREFEGEFTTLGFFEADADVSRTSAGYNFYNKSGESLKSGLFGIFY